MNSKHSSVEVQYLVLGVLETQVMGLSGGDTEQWRNHCAWVLPFSSNP